MGMSGTAARICRTISIMLSIPFPQFVPMTSAPAAAVSRAATSGLTPIIVR
jgi:hypothetical protein